MFGFLRGPPCDREYRQIYAGLCDFQRRHFGLESLPFLSYEAAFLYQFAVDTGDCAPPPAGASPCCRLGIRASAHHVHPILAEYCSSFGMLLASIKLNDDVRDDGSWLARFGRWRLRTRLQKVAEYFGRLDADFSPHLAEILAQQDRLEESRDPYPPLAEYTRPTSAGFGFLFELFGGLLPQPERRRRTLHAIGSQIGSAIIAFDCAADWEADRRRGRFNPLRDASEVAAAREFTVDRLRDAESLCRDAIGPLSRCAALLKSRSRHVAEPGPRRRSARARSWLWPLRPQFSRLGMCDCACDPTCCCDASCCDAAQGCDLLHGCQGCDFCRQSGESGCSSPQSTVPRRTTDENDVATDKNTTRAPDGSAE